MQNLAPRQPWRHAPKIVLFLCVALCVAYLYSCQAAKEAGEVGGGAVAGGAVGFAVGGPPGAGVGIFVVGGMTHVLVENERLGTELAKAHSEGRQAASVPEATGLPSWLFWTIIGLIVYFVFTHPKVVEPFRTLFYALRNRFLPPAVGTHIPPSPPPAVTP